MVVGRGGRLGEEGLYERKTIIKVRVLGEVGD